MASNSKPELSLIMPAIRCERWPAAYESMQAACKKHSFELIIVTPMTHYLLTDNVRYVESHASPVRCLQEGLLEARGRWIGWASDDGIWEPGAIDRHLELLTDWDTGATGRYLEGDSPTPDMHGADYYRLSYHAFSKGLLVPPHYFGFHGPWFVTREFILQAGGFDCRFEGVAMGYCDLAMRLQNEGLKCVLTEGISVKFGHMPGRSGDHGPMHDAQVDHDEPLFHEIYSDPEQAGRVSVDLHNWKLAPARWERRFGKP